jgi:hypothetical protein
VTTYVVKNAQRAERRRRKHERAAAAERREVVMAADGSESILPLLDRAIATLPSKDQAIVIERYLCGHQTTEIAARLGISPDATQKRLVRAIARMRRYFDRHGIVLGAAAIPWPPLQSAPVQLGARLAVNSVSVHSKSLAGKVIMQFFWAKAAVIGGVVGLAVMPLVVLAQSIKGDAVRTPSGAPIQPTTALPLAGAPSVLHLGDGTDVSIDGVFALGDTRRVWTADGKPANQTADWFPSSMNIPKVGPTGGKLNNFGIIFRFTSRTQDPPEMTVVSASGGALSEGLFLPDPPSDGPNWREVGLISAPPGQASADLRLQFTAHEFTPLEIAPLRWGGSGASALVSTGPYGDCVVSKPFLDEGAVAVTFSYGLSQEHRLVVSDGQRLTIGRPIDGACIGGIGQWTEIFDGFHDLKTFPPIAVETQKLSEAQIRNVSLSGAPTTSEMLAIDPMREWLATRPPNPAPASEIYIGGEVDHSGIYTPSENLRTFSDLIKTAGFHGRPEDTVTVIRRDRDHGRSIWASTVSALTAHPNDQGLLEAGEQIIIRAPGR